MAKALSVLSFDQELPAQLNSQKSLQRSDEIWGEFQEYMGASGPCSNCKGLCEQGREVRGMGTSELKSKSVNEEMANHSNIIAWRIPWTAEPGRLQFMELQKVRHDWATNSEEAEIGRAAAGC